jgi:hypothetical protein
MREDEDALKGGRQGTVEIVAWLASVASVTPSLLSFLLLLIRKDYISKQQPSSTAHFDSDTSLWSHERDEDRVCSGRQSFKLSHG